MAKKTISSVKRGTNILPTKSSRSSLAPVDTFLKTSRQTIEESVKIIELTVEIAAALIPSITSRAIEAGTMLKPSKAGVALSARAKSGSSRRAEKPHRIETMVYIKPKTRKPITMIRI